VSGVNPFFGASAAALHAGAIAGLLIGVYDPTNRIFYLRNSNSTGFADLTIIYGPAAATPLAGDWDGSSSATGTK
jgi:ABC-type uncharacterized transport system permease subunit